MAMPADLPFTPVDPLALAAGALDWWREAGVSHTYGDAARGWLAPEGLTVPEAIADDRGDGGRVAEGYPTGAPPDLPARASPAPAPDAGASGVSIGGPRGNWPTSLPEFHAWWLAEPTLEPSQASTLSSGSPRVSPRGPRDAALMIIVPEPEAEDSAALLSGRQGRLFGAMLAMMGIASGALIEDVYYASVLPRHTRFADWAGLGARGLGAVLHHHIALVAPRALIAFGNPIPPLLGHDPAQTTALLRLVNHGVVSHNPPQAADGPPPVPMLIAPSLGLLSERAGARAAFWQHWLDWTAT